MDYNLDCFDDVRGLIARLEPYMSKVAPHTLSLMTANWDWKGQAEAAWATIASSAPQAQEAISLIMNEIAEDGTYVGEEYKFDYLLMIQQAWDELPRDLRENAALGLAGFHYWCASNIFLKKENCEEWLRPRARSLIGSSFGKPDKNQVSAAINAMARLRFRTLSLSSYDKEQDMWTGGIQELSQALMTASLTAVNIQQMWMLLQRDFGEDPSPKLRSLERTLVESRWSLDEATKSLRWLESMALAKREMQVDEEPDWNFADETPTGNTNVFGDEDWLKAALAKESPQSGQLTEEYLIFDFDRALSEPMTREYIEDYLQEAVPLAVNYAVAKLRTDIRNQAVVQNWKDSLRESWTQSIRDACETAGTEPNIRYQAMVGQLLGRLDARPLRVPASGGFEFWLGIQRAWAKLPKELRVNAALGLSGVNLWCSTFAVPGADECLTWLSAHSAGGLADIIGCPDAMQVTAAFEAMQELDYRVRSLSESREETRSWVGNLDTLGQALLTAITTRQNVNRALDLIARHCCYEPSREVVELAASLSEQSLSLSEAESKLEELYDRIKYQPTGRKLQEEQGGAIALGVSGARTISRKDVPRLAQSLLSLVPGTLSLQELLDSLRIYSEDIIEYIDTEQDVHSRLR